VVDTAIGGRLRTFSMTLDARTLALAALSALLVGAPAAVAQQPPLPCGVG